MITSPYEYSENSTLQNIDGCPVTNKTKANIMKKQKRIMTMIGTLMSILLCSCSDSTVDSSAFDKSSQAEPRKASGRAKNVASANPHSDTAPSDTNIYQRVRGNKSSDPLRNPRFFMFGDISGQFCGNSIISNGKSYVIECVANDVVLDAINNTENSDIVIFRGQFVDGPSYSYTTQEKKSKHLVGTRKVPNKRKIEIARELKEAAEEYDNAVIEYEDAAAAQRLAEQRNDRTQQEFTRTMGNVAASDMSTAAGVIIGAIGNEVAMSAMRDEARAMAEARRARERMREATDRLDNAKRLHAMTRHVPDYVDEQIFEDRVDSVDKKERVDMRLWMPVDLVDKEKCLVFSSRISIAESWGPVSVGTSNLSRIYEEFSEKIAQMKGQDLMSNIQTFWGRPPQPYQAGEDGALCDRNHIVRKIMEVGEL